MGKLLTASMLFVVIMTVGFFGQKLGYEVNGMPRGELRDASQPVAVSSDSSGNEWWWYIHPVTQAIYGVKRTQSTIDKNPLTASLAYLYNFATLQIDNVPDWVGLIFDFLVFLALLIIFLFIRGG